MTEFNLITKYFSRVTKRGDVLLGVGDDAAVLDMPANRWLVAAVDTIVEDVHFPKNIDPVAIGHRALAVNLSDMAAMGAEPAWFTLSLAIPSRDDAWLEGFAAGLYRLAEHHNIALVGGDTVRGPLSVSVQILGWVERDAWLTRQGAKPGDAIFVSGIPGEAAAGLKVIRQHLSGPHAQPLLQKFLWPQARVDLGRALRSVASAAIDVSDGLLADLDHICERSECGAQIEIDQVPKSSPMRALFAEHECEAMALSGGDDYELLFTVPAERILDAEAVAAATVRCTPIGRMVEGSGVQCLRAGRPVVVNARGYDHFAAT